MNDKEKVAQWMIERGFATGHGDSIEDLLKEIEWQIEARTKQAYCDGLENGLDAEREACAKVCENMERSAIWITKAEAAAAIRARGKQ
jgi:hypothetical protein